MTNYEKTEKIFYERFWKNLKGTFSFDKTHFSSDVPDKEIFDFIEILKKNNFSGKILDIGCGNSRNGVVLAKQGCKVTGLDISEEAIKLSKMNIKLNKVSVKAEAGNFLDGKYKKGEFGACVDSGLFHHLRKYQWKNYLNSLNMALNPRGFFYLKVFSDKSGELRKFTPPKGRNYLKKNNHINRIFTKEGIENIFGKNFEILKIIETSKGRTPLKFWVFIMRKK